MKRIMIIALLIFIAPCLLKAQGKFLLKGNLGVVKDGAKIRLSYRATGKKKIDSTILQDGRFSFAGSLTGSDPADASLVFLLPDGHYTDYAIFFLESGTIYVNSPDSLKNAVITGSPENDLKNRLNIALQSINNRLKILSSEWEANTDVSAEKKYEIMRKSYALAEERQMIYRKFIAENPESSLSLKYLDKACYANLHYDILAPLFNRLSKKLRNSPEGKVQAFLIEGLKSTRIGAFAPDFTMNDTSGVPVKLSSFRGSYVLLDFWGTFCAPCCAELPNLVKCFNKYKKKNFMVLGASFDSNSNKDIWLKGIHDYHLPWPNGICGSNKNSKYILNDLYHMKSLPMNYLIDPSGKIIAKELHGDALDEKLSEVLK